MSRNHDNGNGAEPDPSESKGEYGGTPARSPADGKERRAWQREYRLFAQALRDRWPIGSETRAEVMAILEKRIRSAKASNRDVGILAKAMFTSDNVNLTAMKMEIELIDRQCLFDRMAELERQLDQMREDREPWRYQD
jgi:hypothetical protein